MLCDVKGKKRHLEEEAEPGQGEATWARIPLCQGSAKNHPPRGSLSRYLSFLRAVSSAATDRSSPWENLLLWHLERLEKAFSVERTPVSHQP